MIRGYSIANSIFAAALLACFSRAPALADEVTFALTGTVHALSGPSPLPNPLSPFFSIGDTVSARYTFESTTPDSDGSQIGRYVDSLVAAQLQVSNGFAASFNPAGASEIVVNVSGSLNIFETYVPLSGPAVNGAAIELLAIGMLDSHGGWFQSDVIPVVPPNISLADFQEGYLQFRDGSREYFAAFFLQTFTLVPEPASAVICLAAAAMVINARGRRKR